MNFTVDACVVRASGESGSGASSVCRSALLALSHRSVRLVCCPTLKDEWRRHASRFGTAWLASMASKGLLRYVSLNAVHQAGVVNAIATLPPCDTPVAMKDAHLVVNAISNNATVLSLEVRCRAKFHLACAAYAPIGAVVWIDPVRHVGQLEPYLDSGAILGPWRLSQPDP